MGALQIRQSGPLDGVNEKVAAGRVWVAVENTPISYIDGGLFSACECEGEFFIGFFGFWSPPIAVNSLSD